METNSEEPDDSSRKVPRIRTLVPKISKASTLNPFETTDDDAILKEEFVRSNKLALEFEGEDILFLPRKTEFIPNQDVDLEIGNDDILQVKVMQEHSTPGVRCGRTIALPRGLYYLTVVGYSKYANTFFPWARNVRSGIRLSEVTHLTQSDDPINIPLIIDEAMEVEFGVLSHNTQIGDTCFIRSIEISKAKPLKSMSSKGRFHSLTSKDFIPHGQTTLTEKPDGLLVVSKPVKTPGAYSIIEVEGGETLSLLLKVSINFPSVAFVYVADVDSGKELTKRENVFRSNANGTFDDVSVMTAYIEIPEETKKIRVGLLFSTVTKPNEHQLLIQSIEVVPVTSLADCAQELYVLSMEGEEEKFDHCQWQADKYGLKLTRWLAVNGNDPINKRDWFQYLTKPFTPEEKLLNRKAVNHPGAWGYLLSMKGIFEDAIKKGHQSIAVFDDDFIISKNFDHNFSSLIQALDTEWDLIYLGASQWSWDGVEIGKFPFYEPNANTNGSFAVIYNRSIFGKILERLELMSSPFDSGPLRDIVLSYSIGRAFVVYPNLVIANVEKPGIRDSRNQKEYSRRFRWNLDDFPAWFTSWQPTPIIMEDRMDFLDGTISIKPKQHYVTGVTTYNRIDYLKNFIETWYSTINLNFHQTLIIADDGSTDGTVEWIQNNLLLPGVKLIFLRNDCRGIARQSNSILNTIAEMHPPPSVGFMCNDDIFFIKNGWQTRYNRAIISSGFDHLVYFNNNWKATTVKKRMKGKVNLLGNCTSREAMGCFYTITPNLIKEIGFFDEKSFPVRGHSHVDFTMRACRFGANDAKSLYDIENSGLFIDMIQREDYVGTHRILTLKEHIWTRTSKFLDYRESIMNEKNRVFISRPW